MKLPRFNQLSRVSKLSLFAVLVLTLGVFVAVQGALEQQEERGRASSGNLVQNSSFENGTTSWELVTTSPGAATFTTTASTQSDGANAAQIDVTNSSILNSWHVQLAQYNMSMTAGQTYTISFWAKASANRSIESVLQGGTDPYPLYGVQSFPVTTTWQQYTYTFQAPVSSSNVFIGFNLAASTGRVWIDNVSYSTGTTNAQPTTSISESSTFIEDTEIGTGTNQFDYQGEWIKCGGCTPDTTNASFYYTAAVGDAVVFRFNGTQVKLYGVKEKHGGIASVAIDGNAAGTIDYYNSETTAELVYTSPVLPGGNHTLTLTNIDQRNAASDANVIFVDKAEVTQGTTTAPTATTMPVQPTLAPGWSTTEPTAKACPSGQQEVETVAQGGVTATGETATKDYAITVPFDSLITVLGYVKEGHPEDCPDGSTCGQNQIYEEIKVLVNGTQIGVTDDQGAGVEAWVPVGPWQTIEGVPAGSNTVTVAHRARSTTEGGSVDYKLTVCSEADEVPQLTAKPQEPSATAAPNSTKLELLLKLHGIGKGGDSQAENGTGNMNPLHPKRKVLVEVKDEDNNKIISKEGEVSFDSSTGKFAGIIDITTLTDGKAFADGVYTVRIKPFGFLGAIVPGIQKITVGQTKQLAETTFITGDIQGDNKIDILDYHILMTCYSDFEPAEAECTDEMKLWADLTDDGQVAGFDLNLFLRELTNREGQ